MNKNLQFCLIVFIILFIVYCCYNYNRTENLPGYPKKEIIYFSARNCKWCKEFQPMWDIFVLNESQNGCVDFQQLDINDNAQIAGIYNVRDVPNIIATIDDKKVATFNDDRTYQKLVKFLTDLRTTYDRPWYIPNSKYSWFRWKRKK